MISYLPLQNDIFPFFFPLDGKNTKPGTDICDTLTKMKIKQRKYIKVQLTPIPRLPPRFLFSTRAKKKEKILPTHVFLKPTVTFICYYL